MARASAKKDDHRRQRRATGRASPHVFLLRAEREPPADQHDVLLSSLAALEQFVLVIEQHSREKVEILHSACRALVDAGGYAGAMVMTLHDRQQLKLRAAALRLAPGVDADLLLRPLNHQLQSARPLLLLDEPRRARHLALRALAGDGQVVESDHIHDVLGPLLSAEEADRAGQLAQVKRVLALPLITSNEKWGCLLLMSHREHFKPAEKRLLLSLAQQIALGLHNARLYRQSEEQQQAAQTFARMAFSASAYLHTLRNQIGSFRGYLDLVQMMPYMPPEQQREVLKSGRKAYESLDQVADILDHLHEPWQQHPQTAIDVNECLIMALLKLFPNMKAKVGAHTFTTTVQSDLTLHCSLAPTLPAIHSSPEMLAEVFRIAINNAVDAVKERDEVAGALWIESQSDGETVCVTVRDNGVGIPTQNMAHIFEIGWSSKQGKGMGFGLFWAKSFVEGLGGHIEVESAPQEGTTFQFILPAGK
ncbi:MAG TPA: ATP-binding protein [Candidatus Sulfomarinibacteraceae bacterium]|nr:ATP-binding protein [Candidatus Sulfomarinibacteraceae bacterium]